MGHSVVVLVQNMLCYHKKLYTYTQCIRKTIINLTSSYQNVTQKRWQECRQSVVDPGVELLHVDGILLPIRQGLVAGLQRLVQGYEEGCNTWGFLQGAQSCW